MNTPEEFEKHIENEKTFWKTIKNAIFVNESVRDERFSACSECDKYKNKQYINGWCEMCLCSPPVKTWIHGQKCPLGKW